MATALLILVVAAAIIVISGCGPKSMNGEKVIADASSDPDYRGISGFNKMNQMETPVETAVGPSDQAVIDPSIFKSMNDEYKQKREKLIAEEVKRGLLNPGYMLADMDDTSAQGLNMYENVIEMKNSQQAQKVKGLITSNPRSVFLPKTVLPPKTIDIVINGTVYPVALDEYFVLRLKTRGAEQCTIVAVDHNFEYMLCELRAYR